MNQDKQPPKIMVIEFDSDHGLMQYFLPYANALEIIKILLPQVPSITVYDYEHRENLRQHYASSTS